MAEEIDTTERDADIRTIRALMAKHGWLSFRVTDYGCIFNDKTGAMVLMDVSSNEVTA